MDAASRTHGPMSDVNLQVSVAVDFDSMIAGIAPVQSQSRVDAMRGWSLHGMHDKSGCPAVRLLLFRSAARVFCRYCGVGSYALLKKCVPKLRASLDCEHLRTPCCPNIHLQTQEFPCKGWALLSKSFIALAGPHVSRSCL